MPTKSPTKGRRRAREGNGTKRLQKHVKGSEVKPGSWCMQNRAAGQSATRQQTIKRQGGLPVPVTGPQCELPENRIALQGHRKHSQLQLAGQAMNPPRGVTRHKPLACDAKLTAKQRRGDAAMRLQQVAVSAGKG